MILAIETATPTCSVAIGESENDIAEVSTDVPQSHSSVLNSQIQEAVSTTGKQLKDLQAIAVSIGPGSYTGLRIGLSAAKGFCYALDIPLIEISTLRSMAKHAIELTAQKQSLYIPLIDARRDEVYTATYNNHLKEVRPPHAHVLKADSFKDIPAEESCYLFGTGASKTHRFLNKNNSTIIEEFKVCASSVLKLAMNKYRLNDFADVAYAEPLYIKKFATNQ